VEQSTRIEVDASVEQVWEVLRQVELWPEHLSFCRSDLHKHAR
jgi:hypothetical protein